MGPPRFARAFFAAWLLGGGFAACQSARPLPVLVRDAETKQPLPGAEVQISYPLAKGIGAPHGAQGVTGSDGIVRLEATPARDTSVIVQANLKGYLADWKDLPQDTLRQLEPPHFFEKVEGRPVGYVVELYAGPKPAVEFVVPAGFKGMFRATTQIKDDYPITPGQRVFSYPVPQSGEVHVVGPPVLRYGASPEFRARTSDGTALPTNPAGETVGLWFLKSESGYDFFLVGTERECAAQRALDQKSQPTSGHRGGGGRGHGRHGHGGGGGGGGGQSTDPN